MAGSVQTGTRKETPRSTPQVNDRPTCNILILYQSLDSRQRPNDRIWKWNVLPAKSFGGPVPPTARSLARQPRHPPKPCRNWATRGGVWSAIGKAIEKETSAVPLKTPEDATTAEEPDDAWGAHPGARRSRCQRQVCAAIAVS